jgi:hypothetical protein
MLVVGTCITHSTRLYSEHTLSNANSSPNDLLLPLGCSQESCLHCCTSTECEAHAESRARQKYHADLLLGNTEIARRAKQVRALALLPGAFRESGFVSMTQTIKIWDLREFMANPKWKEDAVRKSQKRKAREFETTTTSDAPPRLKNSRKRFRLLLDNWYAQSLESK